jgi:uncharacterized UBP type Zn finger protein
MVDMEQRKKLCKYCNEEVEELSLSICENCFNDGLDRKLNEEIKREISRH